MATVTRRGRARLPVLSLLLVGLLLLAARLLLAGPLDAWLMALERTEHLVRYRLGLELRGTPDLARLDARLASQGLELGAPLLVRIFKRESELEVWLREDGRFQHFATYPICRWSGDLGPKERLGDRQAPEGFYTVGASQLNPRSRWHRSFDVGFPNSLDKAHGRTGNYIMVHGGCSSVGCFAVTNAAVDEIWRLVTAALDGGQKRFQVQVFPFRMTDWNLALHRDDRWYPFWLELKAGYDAFEASRVPPAVSACAGRYVVAPGKPGSDGSQPIAVDCQEAASAAIGHGRLAPAGG